MCLAEFVPEAIQVLLEFAGCRSGPLTRLTVGRRSLSCRARAIAGRANAGQTGHTPKWTPGRGDGVCDLLASGRLLLPTHTFLQSAGEPAIVNLVKRALESFEPFSAVPALNEAPSEL